MHLYHYQAEAMGYRLPSANHQYAKDGLIGEVGELYGAYAKAQRDHKHLDTQYVAKELGDVLWFVAALADDHGLNLDDIANTNLTKLKSRQERGVIQGSGDNR